MRARAPGDASSPGGPFAKAPAEPEAIPPSPPAAPPPRSSPAGAGLAAWALRRAPLVAASVAALAFLETLPHPPVLDDGWAVLDNPVVRTLDVRRAFGAQYGIERSRGRSGPSPRSPGRSSTPSTAARPSAATP